MSLGTTLKISFNATEVQRGLNGLSKNVQNFADSIAKAGIATLAVGLAAAAAATISFAKSSSDAAAEMESLNTQFEVLTKSSDTAKNLISDFRKEAAKSPLSVKDYAQAGKTLLAFGMSTDKVMPTLKALGDVSMGNSERFGSLALAFAQTQAAGRLMGQEVLQFVNAGFNPLQQISKTTGRSMVELKKAMEDGAISADMVAQAFQDATKEGGLFYGALEKGSQTTEGKIAKLKDTVFGLKVAFGEGFNEGLKSALDATTNFIPQFEEKMKIAGQFIGKAISEAVMGDTSKFELIGRIIGDGLKLGIKNSMEGVGMSLIKETANLAHSAGDAIGIDKLVDKMEGKKGFYKDTKRKFNLGADWRIQSNADTNFATSDLKRSLGQLSFQSNQIEAANKAMENSAMRNQIASALKSELVSEFSPGGPKVQATMMQALKALLSIDRKLGTPAPAKM